MFKPRVNTMYWDYGGWMTVVQGSLLAGYSMYLSIPVFGLRRYHLCTS